MAIVDARGETGKAAVAAAEKGSRVEVCWMFALTKEKYRIRCNIEAIDYS